MTNFCNKQNIKKECYANQKELCPGDWFTFFPTRFDLIENAGQEVEVTIAIPPDAEFGNYFAIISASPQKAKNIGENGNTATTGIGLSVGSTIHFKVAGKVPGWKKLSDWIKGNFYNKPSAYTASLLGSFNISSEYLVFVLSILILIATFISIVVFFRRRQQK